MVAKITPPSAITRHEQMIMWSIMAGDESAPTQSIQERPQLVSFYIEQQLTKSPSGVLLFIGRVVLPLDEYSTLPAGSKPWLAAQDIPQGATIPNYYSSN